ncbi:MAG: hypothetical protein CSA82_00350 [Actinobacteria bacterium]|nr:MAG: hypothetical protein CSA82_00350 [Actinomycetota bacterium]
MLEDAVASSGDAQRARPSNVRVGPNYRRRLRRRILGALACIVGSAVIIAGALYTAWGQGADTLMMEGAMGWRGLISRVEFLATGLVSPLAIIVVAILVAFVAVLRQRPTLAGRAIGVVIGANITTQVLKWMLVRPDLDVTTALANSLPSGHVTVAMSIALALLIVAPVGTRGLAAWMGALWSTLMGISVMVMAWHRLSDVLVAVLITGAWALLLAPIEERRRHGVTIQRIVRIGTLGAFLLALVLSFFALWGVDMTQAANLGPSDYGFAHFLNSQPWRRGFLAAAGSVWILSVVGVVTYEVDRLCGE